MFKDSIGNKILAFSAFYGYGINSIAEATALLNNLMLCTLYDVEIREVERDSLLLIHGLHAEAPWHSCYGIRNIISLFVEFYSYFKKGIGNET